ncbi:MAG: DUF5011 domain-containing protein, partial [Acholeplasmataceae bacterium]|nr:DUF5011 domain-containing protein [Acholeplasmataceae bacterium]
MKKTLYLLLLIISLLALISCQEEVAPEDLIPPSIVGTKNIDYRIGNPEPNYMDGVAAYDNVDGNITTSIIVDDSDVNLEEVGVYSLVYSVVDSSDNLSTTSVSVSVLPGNQPIDVNIPVIIGYSHIKYVFGDSEPNYLEGVTAFDIEDGYITENIVLDISNVDLNTLGVYTVTYSIEDE